MLLQLSRTDDAEKLVTEPRNIPATLRAIRETLDLTQEELAERLDVSFASVNRWEGGKVRPQRASREAIAALAEEVGIDWVEAEASGVALDEGMPVRPARQRKVRKSAGSSDTASMEKMLWRAACSIRGERDAAKFKDYLLPLLFLKRLSDVFDDEMARLESEYGSAEVAREIVEEDHDLLRFYMPPEARWPVISGREPHAWPRDADGRSTAPGDIGEHLTKAVRAVVRHNPSLSGVIDVVDFAGGRDGERDVNPAKLAEVIETFSDPDYRLGLADVQPDFLGRAYEFLLRKFAEGSGRSGGEFFTPTEVAFLMAHIMRPKPGDKCHDYACGSAGLLIKLQLVAQELDPTSRVPLKLAGQELQAESYATAKMNAIIHDMDVEIARGDTMINPKFKTASGQIDTYDIVVANPMWNQPFSPDTFANDPFDRFRLAGGPTSGKGDWAWLQHTLACLNDRGRAAVVLDTGAVTRGSGAKHEDKERNIRKWFVDKDLIEGVILLPDNLFYNTTAAGVIVVLSKDKPAARRDKVLFLNATTRATKGQPKNYIDDADAQWIADAFLTATTTRDEVALVSRQRLKDADYNLSASRWAKQHKVLAFRPSPHILSEIRDLDNETQLVDATLADMLAIEPGDDGWTLRTIGDLFEISSGKTMSAAARMGPNKVPFLRTSNIRWDDIDLSKVDEISLREHEVPAKLLAPGDLLVCEGGEIGRAAVWDGQVDPMSFQNHLHRLRPCTSGVEPRFYMYFLQSAFTQLGLYEGEGSRTTIHNLSGTQLAALPVPQPPITEQHVIVEVLAQCRASSRLRRQAVGLSGELFQTVLHKLMSNYCFHEDAGP